MSLLTSCISTALNQMAFVIVNLRFFPRTICSVCFKSAGSMNCLVLNTFGSHSTEHTTHWRVWGTCMRDVLPCPAKSRYRFRKTGPPEQLTHCEDFSTALAYLVKHRKIVESLRLERTSKIIKSNRQFITAMWNRPGAIEFQVMAWVLRTEFGIKSQQAVIMFAHSIGR